MEESGLRRSARLSALETSKANKATHNVGPVKVPRGRGGASRAKKQAKDRRETGISGQWLPGKRRGRKRKLAEVEETTFSSVEGDGLEEEHPDHGDSSSRSVGTSSANWLPEKQVLELILDTLQKRDSHEMFAKPVDPKKVEDYYEVIQNPVDFGKIREKLQTGMYRSLKQFEEDVFLIFNNAMNFNASNTRIYRQAQLLFDLGKRIFHALKTNPGNFESELLSMKPKRGRPSKSLMNGRSEGEPTRTLNASIDISCGKQQRSVNGPSCGKEKFVESSTMQRQCPRFNRRSANEDCSGFKYGQEYSFSEIEPRDTYMPISSDSPNHCQPLIYVGQCNVGYIDSLARFTSDLGPNAQKMALKMLQGSEKQGSYPLTPMLPFQGSVPRTAGERVFPIASQLVSSMHRSDTRGDIGESSCRNRRIEIPPSIYCPPRFGISNDSRDAVAEASLSFLAADDGNLNDACSSMRTNGSLNSISEVLSRQPPATSIHAFRETGRWDPGSNIPSSSYLLPANSANANEPRSGLRETDRWFPGSNFPSFSQLPAVNTGNTNDPCNALRKTCSRRAGLDVPLGSFMPAAEAENLKDAQTSFRNLSSDVTSFSQLPAIHVGSSNERGRTVEENNLWNSYSEIFPCPNPLVADSINDGSLSFPAAQMNSSNDCGAIYVRNSNFPTVEGANSFTGYLPTHIGNSNFPHSGTISSGANSIPNSGNAYMAMMAASAMSGLQVPSTNPAPDFGRSKLLELASRNNNNLTLLPLTLPFQDSKLPASTQAAEVTDAVAVSLGNETNLAPVPGDSLAWSEMRLPANAPGNVTNNSHGLNLLPFDGENQAVVAPGLNHGGLSLGQSSVWGQPESWSGAQTNVDISFLQPRVGKMDPWGRDGVSKKQLPPDPPPVLVPQETQLFNAMGGGERASSHGRQAEPIAPLLSDAQLPDLALQL